MPPVWSWLLPLSEELSKSDGWAVRSADTRRLVTILCSRRRGSRSVVCSCFFAPVMFPVSSNAETAEKSYAAFRNNGTQKGRSSNAPIDGIAKHRTGNASRNGHITDMDITLAALPAMKRFWRFFYGTAAKDFKSFFFVFSILSDLLSSNKIPPDSYCCTAIL